MPNLRTLYTALNKLSKNNLNSVAVTEAVIELSKRSLLHLSHIPKIVIDSGIVDKEYFIFNNEEKYSRPVNSRLFLQEIPDEIYALYLTLAWDEIEPELLQKVLYTIAMSYSATADILGTQDKKTPSIFFEIFIANIFARQFQIAPTTQVKVDIAEIKTSLPTDYIFQPQNQHIRIHLPIKLSTRERSIQAWAHQRVLEGIYGVGSFKGVMVVMAETNFQKKTMSVVEVCLPDQWRLYQMYISQMSRIYYLDLPKKYEELPAKFPHIQVKQFSEFFAEKNFFLPV